MHQSISLEYIEQHADTFHSRGCKAICPDCGGHNLYYTEDNGFCYCFNCNASFSVEGTVIKERAEKPKDIPAIRAYYAELAAYYHGCLDAGTRTYLNDRGIDDATIELFKIGFCPPNPLSLYKHPIAVDAGIANTHGSPSLADRIILPYIDDHKVSDMRGRARRKDQDPKYKSLFGSSEGRGASTPFNWERAARLAREHKYIIITEGEIKALIADRYGFPCIAMPGMTTWRRGCIPEADWRIVVVFDSMRDRGAQLQTDRAIAKIHEHIPTIYIGTLPLLEQDKQDIDSYLLHKRGGPDRFRRIIDTAITYQEYRRLRTF